MATRRTSGRAPTPAQQNDPPRPKRSRTPRTDGRTPETSPIVLHAARVFDAALSARGYSNSSFATRVGTTSQTIGKKRSAVHPLALRDLEEYGAALRIPPELFIRPLDELYAHLAAEARGEGPNRGRDLGFPNSPYNQNVAACDPILGYSEAIENVALSA